MEDNLSTDGRKKDRAVTLKSVLFGLMGVLIISGLSSFHDNRIGGTLMVGSHLPAAAYFFILLVALFWNFVCSKICRPLVLSPKELIVVMVMVLVACFPPTSGLYRYFHRQLVLPWYYLASGGKTEWEKLNIIGYLKPELWPQPVPMIKDGILQVDELVYKRFFTGESAGTESTWLSVVPWKAWVTPLMYWGPLVIVMSICTMSISLLVHRQWAHHEQLSYPLAQVATSFLSRKEGKGIPDLFKSKLFWWGFVPIFGLYLLEYLHKWEGISVYVPGMSDILPNFKSWSLDVGGKIPIIRKTPTWWSLNWQNIFFSVVGLSYFVSLEISLTMGLSQILLSLVGVWFFMLSGTLLQDGNVTHARSGAYFGFALILLYTGRTYYLAIFKKAFGFGSNTQADDSGAVVAARLAMISFLGFVAIMVMMGLDWFVALLFALTLLLLFLVFTRIICETGIPFMQPNWFPGPFLITMMGPAALGPGPLVYILYLGTIFCQDPRECLMPFVATSIKIADDAKLNVKKIFWILVVVMILAVSVGFVATAWTLYKHGGMGDGYAAATPPQFCFDTASKYVTELNDTDLFDESSSLNGLAKLKLFSAQRPAVWYILAGALAVLVLSGFRFRFPRFPIHPVLFLIWATYPAWMTWCSFLIGWGIKSLVVRFGGGKVYQKLKPLFIGIIAGELIAVGAAILLEMIYFWKVGEAAGISFNVLPG